MMRRIALFGASFDPPTSEAGHGGIVHFLASLFSEVWLLPVFQHPFPSKRKRVEHTSYTCRLDMLKIQFAEIPNVKIKEAEKEFYEKRERDGLKGDDLIFGTYDLIEFLKAENPNCVFHFVMGGDTLNDLCSGKWRRTEEMLRSTPIVGIKRKGIAMDSVDVTRFQAGIELFEVPVLDNVSSTEVRRRLATGESVDGLVDDRVQRYIQEHHLYGKL